MDRSKLQPRLWDWLIPAVTLLVAVGVLLGCLLWPQPPEATVRVTAGGKTLAELPLSADAEQVFTVDGGYNRVTVANGRVTVSEADCKTQVCVHHRAISRVGESIVCAPHGLVVTIIGEGDAPDLIA